MGYDVYLLVTFPCSENEPIAAIAQQHLKSRFTKAEEEYESGEWEAYWYLQDLAKRTGSNPGPKGGVSSWGFVGNYTRVETFVEVLKPFWRELLASHDRAPVFCHKIWVLYQETDGDQPAKAYQISLVREKQKMAESVTIQHFTLPLSWVSWVESPPSDS